MKISAPKSLFVCVLSLSLAGCLSPPIEVSPPPPQEAPPVVSEEVHPSLEPSSWEELDGWSEDDHGPPLEAFQKSCVSLRRRSDWKDVCDEASTLSPTDDDGARAFFERRFLPHRVRNADGSGTGTITGYYVPDLKGSRTPSSHYRWPLYGLPDDLLVIDLRSVYPELGSYRLRGRLDGRRVVPYWTRGEIDATDAPLQGNELLWVKDPVELFFLHIQGSGRISFEDGSKVMVNYADQNGHPYRSIGRYLLEHGEMTRDQMSMQNIRAWVRKNPEKAPLLLGENPSYIFFRELDPSFASPPGAMGIPLTPGRSIAVDPRTIPLGTPVFLSTIWPGSDDPLCRLTVAQDTGGAIKGGVRADFFWGLGEEAGQLAGRMKSDGRLWVLLPLEEADAGETPPVSLPPSS